MAKHTGDKTHNRQLKKNLPYLRYLKRFLPGISNLYGKTAGRTNEWTVSMLVEKLAFPRAGYNSLHTGKEQRLWTS